MFKQVLTITQIELMAQSILILQVFHNIVSETQQTLYRGYTKIKRLFV